jgi:hypothetical protein
MGKTGKLLVLFLIMSVPSFAAEVNDHREMEKRACRLERWCRVVWVLMWTVFLLFLFIVL